VMPGNLNERVPREHAKIPNVRNWAVRDAYPGRAGFRARPMQFRVVTLNLEPDHKRWSDRLPLISAETAGLRPDVIALNEVCVPLQTARLLRDSAIAATGSGRRRCWRREITARAACTRDAGCPAP